MISPPELKAFRDAEKITQFNFSKLAGVQVFHVSNFERGKSIPKRAEQKINEFFTKQKEIIQERKRVERYGRLFSAIDDCAAKEALLKEMEDRILEYYDCNQFNEGDAILQFLPKDRASQLLDYYFEFV